MDFNFFQEVIQASMENGDYWTKVLPDTEVSVEHRKEVSGQGENRGCRKVEKNGKRSRGNPEPE